MNRESLYKAVNAVREAALSGKIGDSKIFVLLVEVEEMVRVRTGEWRGERSPSSPLPVMVKRAFLALSVQYAEGVITSVRFRSSGRSAG